MSVNFSSLDFSGIDGTDRKLIDHLFMLKEQLEHTLSHLDSENFSHKFFDELTVRVQKGLNLQGVVTFEALARNDTTLINGAYIKTGTVSASQFKTYTISDTTYTYGEVLMYYKPSESYTDEEALLAGGIRMDDEGLGKPESSRFRLWIYTDELTDSAFKVSLKLSSKYRASLEAHEKIYIFCDDEGLNPGNIELKARTIYLNCPDNVNTDTLGRVTIKAHYIDLEGTVLINGEKIS